MSTPLGTRWFASAPRTNWTRSARYCSQQLVSSGLDCHLRTGTRCRDRFRRQDGHGTRKTLPRPHRNMRRRRQWEARFQLLTLNKSMRVSRWPWRHVYMLARKSSHKRPDSLTFVYIALWHTKKDMSHVVMKHKKGKEVFFIIVCNYLVTKWVKH